MAEIMVPDFALNLDFGDFFSVPVLLPCLEDVFCKIGSMSGSFVALSMFKHLWCREQDSTEIAVPV